MKNFNNGRESYTPDSNLHFYYSKGERLARKTDLSGIDNSSLEDRKKRRRKMSLIFTVFDVVIVLLIFGVYKFFWADNVNKNSYEGMNFESQAVLFEDDVLMSLDVIAKQESSIFSKDFEVEFLLSLGDEILFKKRIKGILPAKLKDVKSFSKKYRLSEELKKEIFNGKKANF